MLVIPLIPKAHTSIELEEEDDEDDSSSSSDDDELNVADAVPDKDKCTVRSPPPPPLASPPPPTSPTTGCVSDH